MGDYAHENLSVAIREREDAGYAEIGAVVEGAFIPFGQVKLGDYREAIQRGADEKAEASEAKASRKTASASK